MPFKSKKQMKWMFSAEKRGEVEKGTAKKWASHTPSPSNLPAVASSHYASEEGEKQRDSFHTKRK